MSERVKTNSLHKLVSEERDLLSLQLMSLVKERDLFKDALSKWEEKERSHEAAFVAMEKELSLERQAVEMHKKRVSLFQSNLIRADTQKGRVGED